MSTEQSTIAAERQRAKMPIGIAIALLWLAPIVFVAMVVADAKETAAGRLWTHGWFVPYLLSLLIWKLPENWFRPRQWELRGGFYEAMSVRRFKHFMVDGDMHNSRVRRRIANYRTYAASARLPQLLAETIVAEKAHTMMLLFALWPALFGALTGWWKYAAVVALCNIPANLYPIMLQRYTRARLWKLGARPISKTAKSRP